MHTRGCRLRRQRTEEVIITSLHQKISFQLQVTHFGLCGTVGGKLSFKDHGERLIIVSMFQQFIGHVAAAEGTDAQGPAAVKVTLVRAPLRAPAQDRRPPTTPHPDYISTGSSRD